MKTQKPPWTWTVQKDTTARLVAEGALTTSEIARRLGISRATIYLWKRVPEFRTRIAHHLEQIRTALAQTSITECHQRAEWRMELLDRVAKIVEQIKNEELADIKKNPISAINLLLRLHTSVEQFVQRRQTLHAQYEESEIPDLEALPEGAAENIMAILDRAGAIGNCDPNLSRPELPGIHREDH